MYKLKYYLQNILNKNVFLITYLLSKIQSITFANILHQRFMSLLIKKTNSIYTTQFWLLCLSNFLFSASFQMIIPELPDYLAGMGGKEYIGYIIFLFTIAAGVSRPFSGKLSDTIGRMPVMIFGSLVCFVCGGLYPFLGSIGFFLFLRFIHGFSTGTKPTATAAYVADIIPENRRGEAQGVLGIFTATGMSIGPSIGSLMTEWFDIYVLFYSSSVVALLSILILLNMKETLPKEKKQPFSLKLFKIKWVDVFEPRVMRVFWMMLLVSFSSGVLLTLVPDQTKMLGIKNKGLFFTIYTIASVMVRLFFSKVSDKKGRMPVMKISVTMLVLAMLTIAVSNDIWGFTIAAILFGFSWGFNTPTLTAWTVDLSDPNYRGRAIATMYIALEAGIGLGAYCAGEIYQGVVERLHISYWLAAFLAFVGLVLLFVFDKKKGLN
jgi:MFS family permease